MDAIVDGKKKRKVGRPKGTNGIKREGKGNKLGRPAGSKDRIANDFMIALSSLLVRRGEEILERVADEKPEVIIATARAITLQQMMKDTVAADALNPTKSIGLQQINIWLEQAAPRNEVHHHAGVGERGLVLPSPLCIE